METYRDLGIQLPRHTGSLNNPEGWLIPGGGIATALGNSEQCGLWGEAQLLHTFLQGFSFPKIAQKLMTWLMPNHYLISFLSKRARFIPPSASS